MNSNLLGSHDHTVVGVVDPDLNAAGSQNTGWIAAADHQRFLAVVMAGTLGTASTLDAKIEQATDAGGTGAKDVDGKAITQMTQAGTDNSDKQALINLRPEELDANGGFTHFRVALTTATASSDSAVIVLGIGPAYGPATQPDTVIEAVE